MAGPNFPLIDRRRLLASAAAMTAASAVPGADHPIVAPSDPIQALPLTLDVRTTNVCVAAARRFIEIGRRNQIRQEAGLPLLPVATEWRRVKQLEEKQTRDEAFEQFAAAHEKGIWDRVFEATAGEGKKPRLVAAHVIRKRGLPKAGA